MLNGIKGNFETTFNVGNFVNYLTTDNYNEIKDYSKSVVQTGVTLYGSYNVGKGIYKATHPTEVIMSQVNIANINAERLNQINNRYVFDKFSNSTDLLVTFGDSKMFLNIEYPENNINFYIKNGFEWRGKENPPSEMGSYYNPTTGQSLHPDLFHPEPIGMHWDYLPYKGHRGYRIFPNGTFELK